MEKYSVLTTVYAKENPEFLRQSLDSMLNQTEPPSEYVIVKDGPLPKCLEAVLTEYNGKYPIFKIIGLEVNSGLGVACEKGMEVCSYDLVARLDSDDISLPTRCEKQLAALVKEDDLAVVGSDLYEFEDNPDKITAIKKMPTEPNEIFRFGKRRNPFNHSSIMMRKSIVQANGGYSPMRRSQDLELFTRLLYKGCKCRNIGEPLVLFRTGSARVNRKKNWTNLKHDISVYKRNYQEHYMSLCDYLYVVIRQFIFFLMPGWLAGFLYKKIYRAKA
jgi:glycosyltransferase involved in cell wall biosynthesis